MNGLIENKPLHTSGRTVWSDGEARQHFIYAPREHTLIRKEPNSGQTLGSWFDCWNLDDARERIRLVLSGNPDHEHQWGFQGSQLVCSCTARYSNGRVIPA